MNNKKEIETKLLSILDIKKINKGLAKDEEVLFNRLNKKYREFGKLTKGSFFINSNSKWEKVL